MYINPFVAGIIATLLVEVCFVIIHGILHRPYDDMENEIIEVRMTEDEKDAFEKMLKSLVEKNNEQDNINQNQ